MNQSGEKPQIRCRAFCHLASEKVGPITYKQMAENLGISFKYLISSIGNLATFYPQISITSQRI